MWTCQLTEFVYLLSKIIFLNSDYIDLFKFSYDLLVFYFIVFTLLSLREVPNYQPEHLVFIGVLQVQQQTGH